MKIRIFLTVASIFILTGIISPNEHAIYTSPWIQLFDGEMATFTHNIEPVNVAYVWVAEPVALSDFSVKRPWLEYPGLHFLINVDEITVYNNTGETVIIQAVVE